MLVLTFLILLLFGLTNGQKEGASSYSNQVSGAFKDDFFITNLLAKDYLRQSDFLRRDAHFAPKPRGRWGLASYNPSYLYPPGYKASKINEISITQVDENKAKIFSYDENDEFGPQNWGALNRNCNGFKQSPIDLRESSARSAPTNQSLIIDGFKSVPESITIYNNGHSAAMKFNFKNSTIRIRGGPLDVPYILDNVHWHWGKDDSFGSEHTLNRQRFSAEAHFVTYSSVYASLNEAMNQPKGLAVLGFFYKLDNYNTDQIPIVQYLRNIIEPESQYNLTKNLFTMKDLIKSRSFDTITYKGSLTTPGCLETVTWLVSTAPLSISSDDLAKFRSIKDETGKFLTKNFRPLKYPNRRDMLVFRVLRQGTS